MKMKFVDEIWGGNYWLEVSIAITCGLKLYVVTQDLAWIGHGSAPSCNLCYNYFLSYQLPNKRIHAGVGTLSWVILLNCSINKSCYHRVRYHVFLDLKKKKKKFILETSDLKESFLQKGSTKCSVRMISSYFKSQTEEIPMLSSFYLFILYLYFFAGITQRSLLSAGDRKICQQGSTKCSVRKRGFVLG